jgi:hypothetical protein
MLVGPNAIMSNDPLSGSRQYLNRPAAITIRNYARASTYTTSVPKFTVGKFAKVGAKVVVAVNPAKNLK